MATETKKVSKIDTIANKIDAFLEGLNLWSKKDDDDLEEDDVDSKKADDEDAKKAEAKPATKNKKATDDEDSQDPDDDDDDDQDDDKDMKKKDAEIKNLKSMVAKQNALLKEAKTQLEQKNEDVREEIKSTFKPDGSLRSTKIGAKEEIKSWAQPKTEMAQRAAKLAVTRNK